MTCMLCLYYEVYAAKMSERCQKHLVEFKSIPVWDQFIILIENKTKFHLLISNGDNILQNIYIFFVLKIHSDWQNNRKSCNILKCFIIQGRAHDKCSEYTNFGNIYIYIVLPINLSRLLLASVSGTLVKKIERILRI
jgi:hypothetical protein